MLADINASIQKADLLHKQEKKRKHTIRICECGHPGCRIGPFITKEI